MTNNRFSYIAFLFGIITMLIAIVLNWFNYTEVEIVDISFYLMIMGIYFDRRNK